MRKGSFYWKNLIVVLIAACLPAVLIGVSIYSVGTDRIIKELNNAHQTQLEQTIQRFDEYLTQLELFSAQLAFNPDFNESLNGINFAQQFEKTRDLYKSLQLMKQSNPLIESISLYLENAEKVISDLNGVNPVIDGSEKELYHALLAGKQSIYVTDIKQKKAIVVKLPIETNVQPFGAFLVFLDKKVLDRLVNSFASDAGIAFMMEMDGTLITTDKHAEDPRHMALKEALKQAVLTNQIPAGTFVHKFNSLNYSVSQGEISRLGSKWIYVSATPITQITQPVTAMSKAIILVSLLGLVIALAISWITSNRLYHPIQRLLNLFHQTKGAGVPSSSEIAYIEAEWKQQLTERHALETRIQQSLPYLREGFLQQFFQGRFVHLTEQDVAERLQQFEWNIHDKRFAFLVVKLHGLASGKVSGKDEQLVAFASTNIIDELCSSRAQHVHVFNFQDLHVGAMLVMSKDMTQEDHKKILLQLSKDIVSTIGSLLWLKVTIVISRTSESVLHTPEMLEEARRTLRYRNMTEEHQLLDVQDFFISEENSSATFPFELEREIIHDLRMGLEEKAVLHVREFMTVLQHHLGTELRVQEGMLKLLGSIYDAVWKSGINPHHLYKDAQLFEMLLQIRETHEMIEWFQIKVIRPYVNALSRSYNTAMKEVVEKIEIDLREEFLSNISLEQYADRYGVSVFKLSRGFKQVMGENFIDYVTRLRLCKCMELLLATDLKVNEIAYIVQYNPPYFVRVFKKHTGMTPGQYREMHKKNM
ncbi:helix-turn-helix domain-containing protein [Paenibacillus dendrobii]|nr:helix-turn-helix domain-containing protein [Paenibacillus dendrobii]